MTTPATAAIEVRELHKYFGDNEVLKGIDFEVAHGHTVCVIGPSGSGKSTLLRCVNLLEAPTSGTIIVEGIDALAQQAGRKKLATPDASGDTTLQSLVQERALAPLTEAMRIKDKGENYSRVDEVLAEMLEALPEDYLERKGEAKKFFKGLQEKVLRDEILERNVRLDGRKFDYRTNERLQKALELKLFQDQKDTIKLTSLVSNVVDKDTQEKIDIVKGRLIRTYGYDEDSATDVLNYVASIFARGDVKRGSH